MKHPVVDLGRGLGAAFRDSTVRKLLLLALTFIAVATVFYMRVEGWRAIDAVYFSVMTISTVGYGDIAPQTDLGKIFTIFYVLCGLGVFIAAATAIADRLISSHKDPD